MKNSVHNSSRKAIQGLGRKFPSSAWNERSSRLLVKYNIQQSRVDRTEETYRHLLGNVAFTGCSFIYNDLP